MYLHFHLLFSFTYVRFPCSQLSNLQTSYFGTAYIAIHRMYLFRTSTYSGLIRLYGIWPIAFFFYKRYPKIFIRCRTRPDSFNSLSNSSSCVSISSGFTTLNIFILFPPSSLPHFHVTFSGWL